MDTTTLYQSSVLNILHMSSKNKKEENYIVNAHIHTFTKDHTPKYIAKRFIPWPIYWLLETSVILPLVKKYINRNKKGYTYTGKNKKWEAYKRIKFFKGTPVINIIYPLILGIIWVVFLHYLFELIKPFISDTLLLGWISELFTKWLGPILPPFENFWNTIVFLLLVVFAFKRVRKGVKGYLWSQIKKLVGKDKLEFLLRYINIIRFINKDKQAYIFNDVEQQYPPGTKFVVLPMDMEGMDAGPVETSYLDQMSEVLRLKSKNPKTVYPFIFIDPRRIAKQDKDDPFFAYDGSNLDAIELKACSVKDYFDGGCVGIKIYPSLGYYPFDKELLPLWLYCAQNDIPITTHCSVGPIFYRGKKDKNWDRHPIFEEAVNKDAHDNQIIEKLRLGQLKNKDFQQNFTHPLNYVCLLNEPWLKKLLDTYNNPVLNDLFGYKDGELARNLSTLKVNLAHYGGSENWDQFLAQDRYEQANKIINNPVDMLNLKHQMGDVDTFYQLWHHVDWFSIISSMMTEFDYVYTDVSYTVHDNKYINLLSEILNNPKIQERVLFGTDFYVVSNHKTEKEFWIDMQNTLSTEKWKMLSYHNPKQFLNL
jgi:predicted TIM-barrel fold metal-dependent hydrolase